MDDSKDYFDEWAETYDLPKDLPLFLKWNFRKILEKMPKKGKYTIIDLGTGNGILLIQAYKYNPDYDLIGVDFSLNMLNRAKKNLEKEKIEAKLIKSNLLNINLKDNSADYVISNNAFHHIKDKKKLYSEIYRILKLNGKLIYADSHDASDNEFEHLKEEIKRENPGFAESYTKSVDDTWVSVPRDMKKKHPPEYHYTFKEVRAFLTNAGFKKIDIIPSPSYFAVVYAEK